MTTALSKPSLQGNELYLNVDAYTRCLEIAEMFSTSSLVPQHFRNKKEDCFIIVQWAFRLGIEPFAMLQNTYVVHGKPGMEAKMVIALANSSGKFATPLRWRMEGVGDMRKAIAYATDRLSGEVLETTYEMQTAIAEGLTKNSSKWKNMPDLMLQYRSATQFTRLYCPELLMGISSRDEIEDAATAPEYVEAFTAPEPTVEALPEPNYELSDDEMREQYKEWSTLKKEAYQRALAEFKDADNPDPARAAFNRIDKYFQ